MAVATGGWDSLQADNTNDEHKNEDGEDIGDAEGKAENHRQDAEPRRCSCQWDDILQRTEPPLRQSAKGRHRMR